MTGYKRIFTVSNSCYLLVPGIEHATPRWSHYKNTFLTKHLNPLRHASYWTMLSEFWGLINLISPSTYEILTTFPHDFYLSSYCNFSSSFFDEWFPNRIHLYTWSAQYTLVTQHVCCFFKTPYSPMFFLINYFNLILFKIRKKISSLFICILAFMLNFKIHFWHKYKITNKK